MTEQRQIAKRAGVVGFLTLISRVAGLIRDVSIAHAFGTKLAADAFFVAFRIPNLLRRLFAEGALTVSFVPVFTQSLKESREEAKRVVDVTFSLMVIVMIGVSLMGVVLAPWLVRLTAWGFVKDPEKFELTVLLTRVMFPYIFLVSLAAWAMGILNSLKHFSSPAASPIFMNLGIILGALLFIHWCTPPILGLALGVLIGGAMQLGCHFPFLAQFGFWPQIKWDPSHPAIKRVLGMMVPAAYGAAVYQFNVIAITLLASFLKSGSVSYLWYADRIMEFPLGIFAISLSTVILPTLSDHAAVKDIEALKKTFAFGLRMIFFITLPAMAGLIVLSEPIIRILFQHGTFSPESTLATSQALICFAVGLPFISGVRMTSNAFYSLQDSKTPVRVANLSVGVNLVLSLLLMFPLQHNGLALAVSLASLFNFVMHLVDFRKKVGPLQGQNILQGVLQSLLATAVMTLILVFVRHYAPHWISAHTFFSSHAFWGEVVELFAFVSLGGFVYLVMAYWIRMEEMRGLMGAIFKKLGRA